MLLRASVEGSNQGATVRRICLPFLKCNWNLDIISQDEWRHIVIFKSYTTTYHQVSRGLVHHVQVKIVIKATFERITICNFINYQKILKIKVNN